MNDPDRRSHCELFFAARQVSPERIAKAQWILDLRNGRAQHFDEILFGEPAWDLLLTLYAVDRCVCTSQLATYTSLTTSVTARWLDVLEQQDLVC